MSSITREAQLKRRQPNREDPKPGYRSRSTEKSLGSFADSQPITVSDDSSVGSLFQSKAPRFVRGWSLEPISQSVESTEEHIIGELQAVRSRAQGPGTGTRDRRERGDDLHLEIEDGGVNISDLWRSPISSFRCPAALVAYCPFSFCASPSACLKSFLIECTCGRP